MKILGVLLIVLGVIGIAYGGVRYAYPDKIVDAGPVHISVTKHDTVPIPPILGGLALVGGIAVIAMDRRKTG
jgi:hypothetical protein